MYSIEGKTTPRIYVACLASYNEGHLHGKWIDANQDEDEIYAEVQAMLADSPVPGAEEWAVHDYEGFGGARMSEYEDFADVSRLAKLMEEHGAELVCGLKDAFGGTLDEIERKLEDDNLGLWDSVADYLEDFWESIGELEKLPKELRYYIDWDKMAHDADCGGDFIEVEADGRVHLFSSY